MGCEYIQQSRAEHRRPDGAVDKHEFNIVGRLINARPDPDLENQEPTSTRTQYTPSCCWFLVDPGTGSTSGWEALTKRDSSPKAAARLGQGWVSVGRLVAVDINCEWEEGRRRRRMLAHECYDEKRSFNLPILPASSGLVQRETRPGPRAADEAP